MNQHVPFSCPQCGSTTFKVHSEPTTFEEFIGAECDRCGTKLTEDEVQPQAVKIAEAAAKKAFRNSGLI